MTPENIKSHLEAVMQMLNTRYDGDCRVTVALRFEHEDGSAVIMATNEDRLDLLATAFAGVAEDRGHGGQRH